MTNDNEQTPASASRRKSILFGIGLPAWVLAGFIVSALIIGFAFEAAIASGLLGETTNPSLLNTLIAALVYMLSLVIVIGVPLKLKGIRTTKEELGLSKKPTLKDAFLAPAGFIIYLICAGVLVTLVSILVPGFDAEEAQDVGFENITSQFEYILAFITLVLLAPVAEEVLVRGYLYGKLRKVMPIISAAIISSLLFSLMHFQWNVAINVLPLAIVMVALREMTGSIWSGIFLHMLKNGVAYYLLFINPSLLNTIGI